MILGYTMGPGRGDTDLILAGLAADLDVRGIRCCGTVQINSKCPGAGKCDMDVKVLPDGPVLRISQDLGPRARGCRLDAAALETAVGLVSEQLEAGADLLIVNKFGKHEVEGRGFREVIAQAAERGMPVLVGLNGLNQAAFEEFVGGPATQLPPDPAALLRWVEDVVRTAAEPA